MNKNLSFVTLAGITFALSPLRAEGDNKPLRYELKNKSSFSAADNSRPPFWPIGWVKRVKGDTSVTQTTVANKPVIEASQFKVTSILLGPPSLAVINGRAYGEGEFLKQPRGTAPVAGAPRIRVQQIADGQVMLRYEEQSITVAFYRPEIAKRGEQGLLLEDR